MMRFVPTTYTVPDTRTPLTCAACGQADYVRCADRVTFRCTGCGHSITAADVFPHMDAEEVLTVIDGTLHSAEHACDLPGCTRPVDWYEHDTTGVLRCDAHQPDAVFGPRPSLAV